MDDFGANLVNDGLIIQEAPEGSSKEDCKNFGIELLNS